MRPHELVAHVDSKAALVELVHTLAEDLAANRESWENPTLESYLEALAGWLEDSDGYYRNLQRPMPSKPSWEDVATMLVAATMYE